MFPDWDRQVLVALVMLYGGSYVFVIGICWKWHVHCVYLFIFFVWEQIDVDELWGTAASGGWRPSSAPRSDWPRMFFFNFSSINVFDFVDCLRKWFCMLLFSSIVSSLKFVTCMLFVNLFVQLLQQKLMGTYVFVVMVASISREVRWVIKTFYLHLYRCLLSMISLKHDCVDVGISSGLTVFYWSIKLALYADTLDNCLTWLISTCVIPLFISFVFALICLRYQREYKNLKAFLVPHKIGIP